MNNYDKFEVVKRIYEIIMFSKKNNLAELKLIELNKETMLTFYKEIDDPSLKNDKNFDYHDSNIFFFGIEVRESPSITKDINIVVCLA